jgi:hypothetical protein
MTFVSVLGRDRGESAGATNRETDVATEQSSAA